MAAEWKPYQIASAGEIQTLADSAQSLATTVKETLTLANLGMSAVKLVAQLQSINPLLIALDALADEDFARNELGSASPVGAVASDRLNIHGGAIALGHPVGTTGTRLVLTLLRALRARGLKRGLATLCIGGGQGAAMSVSTVAPE